MLWTFLQELAFDFIELIKRLTIVFFWNLFIGFLPSFIIHASLDSCLLLISLRADQWLHLWINFLFYPKLEGTGHVSNVFSALSSLLHIISTFQLDMVPVFFWTPLVPGIIVLELFVEGFWRQWLQGGVIRYSEFELSPILTLI